MLLLSVFACIPALPPETTDDSDADTDGTDTYADAFFASAK